MTVLGLELSTARGSVAVVRDGNQMFAREFANDRHNSAEFFAALTAAQELFAIVDRIAVGLGPGSYAGTRIAISTAVGLQLAKDVTLIGLPSICAFDVPEREYHVAGDARRKSFWTACVSDAVAVEMPNLLSEDELRARVDQVTQPVYSAERLAGFADVALAFPSAVRLARIASADHPNATLPPLQPLYLRAPNITVSKQPVWKAAT